jgi:hypothetical protein
MLFANLLSTLHGLLKTSPLPRKPKPQLVRLEVETLDERVLPSSVPILTGDILDFNPSHGGTHYLKITSETDNGHGFGTFTGYFVDAPHNVFTNVSGSIWLISMNPWGWGAPEFGMAYSGMTTNGFYQAGVIGGGVFSTNIITSNPSAYTPGTGAARWLYGGWDNDYSYSLFGFVSCGNNSDTAVYWIVPSVPYDNGPNLVGIPG